ncbi:hypothetical protein BDN70DRAFT_886420 [Pholiota conissans]|uniref:Uncharacterized protein n=1 Tax=Pholiota conissans TaxID=109636 RepID=A0A9P5YQQ1_9AGAR|nr:hypothetical protein BDN70DRAFT_886420 [Pholiota conissans]
MDIRVTTPVRRERVIFVTSSFRYGVVVCLWSMPNGRGDTAQTHWVRVRDVGFPTIRSTHAKHVHIIELAGLGCVFDLKADAGRRRLRRCAGCGE